ncbi:SDR family oxidoreductase [Beggiatoa leptomitoformis]|uniref:NAD-dependent epimerase/dehydratase family protein n=1 Tax=Beggiatoa leptomitoformis TaxID=288004 RepID=A0A2N9YFS0_9GAMM|nr:SDR family oxidoreductase [Beggiatoa leptomitoformis]ALG68288.1 NAD-dependent epimerase/dehydratase family protein [Beggiatoa leptomitoformis]AUI69401.1 NAD-dependent epimerase/dehydratase family protein [Beggiatoa leptomitoformis]
MQDIFIVGCGYVGLRLAQTVLAEDEECAVMALVRSTESNRRLQEADIMTVPGDLDRPSFLTELPTEQTILYYFAPPPATGITDPRITHLLNAFSPTELPAKIVYISTTGVYGDCGGDWVTEARPTNPQTDRARRRVDAENTLTQWCDKQKIPLVILRVAGIYGAGRLPIERLKQKTPVLAEALSPFSNRIHVDDLVEVCLIAGDSDVTGIFNVTDGNPTTMTDYFNHVADALKLPRPPVVDKAAAQTELSTEMLSYLAESKRISNEKMRTVLEVELFYPDLKSGLQQCLEEM